MIAYDETDEREAHEAVCEELRGIAEAVAGQKAPVVKVSVPPAAPTPVTLNPSALQVMPSERPKSMHFTGTYNGKAVDLTITCTY